MRRWAAAGLLAAGLAPAQDWPQFLGPARNGAAEGLTIQPWGPQGPPVVWKRDAGQGFSGPVVAEGRLILFHRVGGREKVECLDAATGKPLWSYDYPTSYRDDFGFDEGPRGTPAIAGGRVYTYGAEGALHCLDLTSGKKIWSVETQKTFGASKGFFGAACSPLVEGDRVLVGVGGKSGGIVAFHKDTGQVLWTATTDEAGYSSPAAATIGGERHALFFTRSGLVDLDPAAGKVRFQFPWRSRGQASVNAATPLVAPGGLVFLSASYGTGAAVLEVKGTTARKLWSSDDVLSNHYATSVYRDGYLYGYHGRQEEGPSLRSVELKTGKVAWSEDGFRAGTVTLVGDQLLVLREGGELLLAAATPKGFRPSARAPLLPATMRAYPALADGRLYARNERTLICVRLK